MESKIIRTMREMGKTAQHHYGVGIGSLPKFVYYSTLCRNTFLVFSMDLAGPVRPPELDTCFVVLKPSPHELDCLRKGKELTREFFYDKMHGVKRCYVVTCGKEIAYIHWVYAKGDPSRFLKLREGVAELNYNTTLPRFRGKGLMGKMMAYISQDLKTEGFTKVVGVIHEKNHPAIRNARWAGWKETARIRTFGPFNTVMEI